MPHNHIFMQQGAVASKLITTTTGYMVDRQTSIEKMLAQVVGLAFSRVANEELDHNQIVQYPLRLTSSMPVDVNVNITAWYTPERAPHFEAIQQEVLRLLKAWAPELEIRVHLIVVGEPVTDSGSSRTRVGAGMVHEIAEGDADFRRSSRGR